MQTGAARPENQIQDADQRGARSAALSEVEQAQCTLELNDSAMAVLVRNSAWHLARVRLGSFEDRLRL